MVSKYINMYIIQQNNLIRNSGLIFSRIMSDKKIKTKNNQTMDLKESFPVLYPVACYVELHVLVMFAVISSG